MENANVNRSVETPTDSNNTLTINNTTQQQPSQPQQPISRRLSNGRTSFVNRVIKFTSPNEEMNNTNNVIVLDPIDEMSSNVNNDCYSKVKIPTPKPFTRKLPIQALTVQTFIRSMDRYLAAVKIDCNSVESKLISVRYLEDNALIWFDYIEQRKPETVSSWNKIKQSIKERYQPIAQEQISMRKVIRARFHGSVQAYNDEFLQQLQLLPSYGNPACEPIFMSLYLNGIEVMPNTKY